MKITEDNFTITTIYFDGQFWCALIEQCRDGENYAGRSDRRPYTGKEKRK
ncbi:MAG: YjdF family protein [Treponema sp.]|nr:YjdF family protein [Treponema sp.]